MGLVLLTVYTVLGVFSLQWATVKGAGAAIWLPAGAGFAGLLMGGVRLWPAIFVGRLLAGALSGTEQPLWSELSIAVSNTLTSVLGVWLLQGRSGITPPLNRMRTMLRFLFGAALVPAALAAAVGTTCLALSAELPLSALPLVWLRWAAGNAASVMVIGALVIAWGQDHLSSKERLHLAVMLAVTTLAAGLIFVTGPELRLLTWHIYPLLIWAALALRTVGAASALLVTDGLAVAGVLLGVGPFVELDPHPVDALFYLQQFLVVTASTILLLSAVADERRGKAALEKAQQALRRLNDDLEARVIERTEALRSSERNLLQAQKMEAVGQLTGGIAHDFNNLLQTIGTSLDLIVRQPEAAEQVARFAQTAKRATQRGAKLTRQLLTFSRKQELELRSVAIAPLLQHLVDMLHSTLGSAIEVDLQLGQASDTHVFSDPTQLELMVINLAVNARDAMPGGGTLTLGVSEEHHPGDAEIPAGRFARLWVRDTGHGMPEDIASRAFEPFFTTKGPGHGTGLGLSMVYGVAKQSGGKAEIESAPGRGTTVSVWLPCVEPQDETPEPPAEPARPLPAGLRVLLVEPDPAVRDSTAAMLDTLGCEVREAASASDVLAQLSDEPPDVFVLNHALNAITGIDLARQLRRNGVHTPIVLTAGDSKPNGSENDPSLGIEHLVKPFELRQLQQAISAALQPRRASTVERA
jgi:signal transduction histidine kinase/ActR/RegA family two-component response regulator